MLQEPVLVAEAREGTVGDLLSLSVNDGGDGLISDLRPSLVQDRRLAAVLLRCHLHFHKLPLCWTATADNTRWLVVMPEPLWASAAPWRSSGDVRERLRLAHRTNGGHLRDRRRVTDVGARIEGDARWLVVMPSLYGSRGALELEFVATFAERLRLAHDTATVDTYEILGTAADGET